MHSNKEIIDVLNFKLNKAEKTIKTLESKNDELKTKLRNKNEIIKDMTKRIKNLEDIIKEKDNNKQFIQSFYTRDQMLALNFNSTDQTLNFAVPCTKKDIFVDVEKKIYDKYPEHRETNHDFLAQGKKILKFKSVEENELESGIPIIMTNIQKKINKL